METSTHGFKETTGGIFCVALYFLQSIFADGVLPQKNHCMYPKPYYEDIGKVIKVDIINEYFATLLEEDSVISWLPKLPVSRYYHERDYLLSTIS